MSVISQASSFGGQPLLRTDSESTISLNHYASYQGRRRTVGEVVGGTAAECAAVFCCCPCGVANIIVLILYKIPIGLCRRALRRISKKKKKRCITKRQQWHTQELFRCSFECDETEIDFHWSPSMRTTLEHSEVAVDDEVLKLEEDMWRKFHRSGFSRSPSHWISP